MKPAKPILYLVVVASIAGLVYGAVYLRGVRAEQHAQVAPPAPAPWALHSANVTHETVTTGFMALAVKKADSEISITPQIAGTILSMGPREGQSFQPGTILAQIDATEINDEIAVAQANLDSAIQQEAFLLDELTRQQTLLEKGFTTQEKAENAHAIYIAAQKNVTALRHQLAQLKTRRGYTVITADKSGTIAARLAEPGDLAAPGRPIYLLSVAGKTRFSIKVPQSVLVQLEPGSLVELNSGGSSVMARLTRINRTLDSLSMGSVEIDLTDAPFNLPAGARVPARVITGQVKDALTVPVTAIALSADGNSGFVVKVVGGDDNATLQKVPVEIIRAATERAAVSGDLMPGDRVITAQQAVLLKLKTGDAAIIAKGMAQ